MDLLIVISSMVIGIGVGIGIGGFSIRSICIAYLLGMRTGGGASWEFFELLGADQEVRTKARSVWNELKYRHDC